MSIEWREFRPTRGLLRIEDESVTELCIVNVGWGLPYPPFLSLGFGHALVKVGLGLDLRRGVLDPGGVSPFDSLGITPDFFEGVVAPGVLGEDVDDEIAVIDQNPATFLGRRPFRAWSSPRFFISWSISEAIAFGLPGELAEAITKKSSSGVALRRSRRRMSLA